MDIIRSSDRIEALKQVTKLLKVSISKPSQRIRDVGNLNNVENEESDDQVEVNNVNGTYPQTFAVAMKTSEAAQWQEAINVELKALRDNRTWIAVPKPENAKALHTKWVFKTKTDAAGQIERFKARLVVCGNEQEEGVNYSSTFAPVMDMATTRFILALAMLWGGTATTWGHSKCLPKSSD